MHRTHSTSFCLRLAGWQCLSSEHGTIWFLEVQRVVMDVDFEVTTDPLMVMVNELKIFCTVEFFCLSNITPLYGEPSVFKNGDICAP
jgi:hypothetical protein